MNKILVAVIALNFIVACERDMQSSVHSPLAACPGFAETGEPPLVSGAECGTLEVAENPTAIGGTLISLNILRLPAITAVPEPDPLFVIAGGPGQSAVELAETILHFLGDIRQHRDLVFVDQRGTGKSHPLDCETLPDLSSTLDLVAQKQQLIQAVAACAQQHGERMLFYTTPYAVEDLEAVPVAGRHVAPGSRDLRKCRGCRRDG
jgi:pimeloyl-ACP methyl ester carboxylesterase